MLHTTEVVRVKERVKNVERVGRVVGKNFC